MTFNNSDKYSDTREAKYIASIHKALHQIWLWMSGDSMELITTLQ